MKKTNLFLYLLALLCGAISCKKEIVEKVPESSAYSLYSGHMNKSYTFHILYPEGYDASSTYHTLVLLDANDYFVEMANEIQKNTPFQYVLVGVSYNDFNERQHDFTYPAISEVPSSGYANGYIRFLGDELLPYLAETLHIKSSKTTLMGHSLSGYFATYLLFQQDYVQPFDNIIAASPSLWWGDGYIFGLEQSYAKNHTVLENKLFLTMGDLEGTMMNTHFNAFTKRLYSRNYRYGDFMIKRYDNTSHRNSPIKSFMDGLQFIQ